MTILQQCLFLAQDVVVKQGLEIMWKGMLSIIIAIAIIVACIYIMQFIIQKYEKSKAEKLKKKEEEQNAVNENSSQNA